MKTKVLKISETKISNLRLFGRLLEEVKEETSRPEKVEKALRMVRYINTLSPRASLKKMTL